MIRDTPTQKGVTYGGSHLTGTTVMVRCTRTTCTNIEGRPAKSRGPHSCQRVRADSAFGYRVGGSRPSCSATRLVRFPIPHTTRHPALGIAPSIADQSVKGQSAEASVLACRVPVSESSTHMTQHVADPPQPGGGMLSPDQLPVAYLRLLSDDESLLKDVDLHVLGFVSAHADAGNKATMQSLLSFPGWSRNDLLGAVLGLEFIGALAIEPRWTREQWISVRDHDADEQAEAARQTEINATADHLMKLTSYWFADPVAGSMEAIVAAAERNYAEIEYPDASPVVLPDVSGWPSVQHLRLHLLAERQGGWVCRDCRIGLVDVCSDDDMVTDPRGGRFVSPASGKALPTIDHEVPQSLGGSNLPVNLALVCRPCNSSKGAS